MTFGKALVALKAGKTIKSEFVMPIRMAPGGQFETEVRVGWIPSYSIPLQEMVKDDWEIVS